MPIGIIRLRWKIVHWTYAAAQLTLNYPLGNRAARANLDLNQAVHQQNLINTQELKRAIYVQLGVDITTLERRLQEVKEAKRSVQAYLKSSQDLLQTVKAQLADENKTFNLIWKINLRKQLIMN